MADEAEQSRTTNAMEAVRDALQRFEQTFAEFQRVAGAQVEEPDITPELRPLITRLDTLVQRLDGLDERLVAIEGTLEEMQLGSRPGLLGASGPVVNPKYMQDDNGEAALSAARLSSQLSAQKKVTEELQQRLAETTEKSSVFTPKQLFRQFAEEVGDATEDETTDFAIDDVEVAVTGSLGADHKGEMAMGFNLNDQVRPETATQLRFKLRRKSKTRIVK